VFSADTFILSKEPNSVVLARARKLQLVCHFDVKDKLQFFTDYLAQHRPDDPAPFAGAIFLGNDLNDLPLMRRVGYAVAPSDAHALVRDIAHCVLPQRGGEGFVRAFLEQLLRIDQFSPEALDALLSGR
jgi:N-acylneuraminate cytidylyltransferase